MQAVDGDGAIDVRINPGSARTIADHVDAGVGTAQEIALRSKVLTFYVNRAPFLLEDDPAFAPTPNQTFPGRELSLNLLADDEDPYDPETPPPVGGPSPTRVLRWSVRIRGAGAGGSPVSFTPTPEPVFQPDIHFVVPDDFVSPHVTVEVQLCDCAQCEIQPGSGRCATYSIPVTIDGVTTAAFASPIAVEASTDRVLVRWRVRDEGPAQVERRTPNSGWIELGDGAKGASREVSFEDNTVAAGTRYAYRLMLGGVPAGAVWVDVPSGADLSLVGLRPNPATGGNLSVHFALRSSAPARLEMLDPSGRVVFRREVGSLGGGAHVVRLGSETHIPPGVYMLRLTQGGESRVTRAAVLE
jgi:hypothetical protein